MKIFFITRGFPSIDDPMSGNYEAVQAKAIAALGHQVSVISVYKGAAWSLMRKRKISHRIIDNVSVYEGFSPSFLIRLRYIKKFNQYLRKRAYRLVFERVVKNEGMPDIVHAHILSVACSLSFIKDKYHLPFVITEHWTKTNVTKIPKWLRSMSNIYHQADKVICVSQALADSLKRNFQIDSIVINNMVSNLFFQSSKNDRNDQSFRFVACGAFRENRNKGFDILLDAFVLGKFPKNVSLDIVGDGPDRPFIESKIVQNNLSDQIHLLGVKKPEEVSDLLCNSDCFVLSSRLETFSIVVIEAMAKGLPVVATRCGGPETFLLPEHGILVEKENVGELAEAMNYMCMHYLEYDSEKIRKYCYDHFSQNVIAGKIIDVYSQLLNKH